MDAGTGRKPAKRGAGLFIYVCAGLLAGLLIKLFVLEFMTVSGTSMEPSIHEDSVVAVDKRAFGLAHPWGSRLVVRWASPARGDVVVFLHEDKAVVKRVVAVAGDSLSFSRAGVPSGALPSYDENEFSAGGFSSDTFYMDVGGILIPLSREQYQKIGGADFVPEGTALVVGDNYAESIDSRDYGFVDVRDILGKVICR